MKKIFFIFSILILLLVSTFVVNADISDYNDDGIVNFADYIILAKEWSIYKQTKLDKGEVVGLKEIIQFSQDVEKNFGKKSVSSSNYAINKIRPFVLDNRVDVHVTFRNLGGRIENMKAVVYLIDQNSGRVLRSVDNSVRLDSQEIRREMFSFDNPGDGKYVVMIEADDGRVNGFSRRFISLEV